MEDGEVKLLQVEIRVEGRDEGIVVGLAVLDPCEMGRGGRGRLEDGMEWNGKERKKGAAWVEWI